MSWVEIISSVLGLACVFLAGRGSKYNFYVGYVYNAFLFVLCLESNLFSALVLCIVSLAINAGGHYRWTHPREGERSSKDPSQLKVSAVRPVRWLFLGAAVLAAGALWALLLQERTSDVSPWLGSYIMMVTFLAQYLSAGKHWECWIVWMVVNAANIALYCTAGRYLMAATYGLYILNGVWSLSGWLKKYHNNV